MTQDRESGAAGDEFGRATAPRIAESIGATMLGSRSNEATFDGARVVIKCAAARTDTVGVTYKMLERLESVIGAFENEDGSFDLVSLPASAFKRHMRETRSRGAAAGKVGLVRKATFLAKGKSLGVVTL